MFNVCPGCGEYTDAKEVLDLPSRAVCPVCKHEHPFKALPLFVVTGASGSGKTTVALQLLTQTQEYVVLDQDILWSDAFDTPETKYLQFRNTWLRLIKSIHQSGRSAVLFGSTIPEQYESCVERRYFSQINYLALVCEAAELERRLKQRPQWRKSGSSDNIARMLEFNQWLTENAAKTQPPMALLDTSTLEVGETTEAVRAWLARHAIRGECQ